MEEGAGDPTGGRRPFQPPTDPADISLFDSSAPNGPDDDETASSADSNISDPTVPSNDDPMGDEAQDSTQNQSITQQNVPFQPTSDPDQDYTEESVSIEEHEKLITGQMLRWRRVTNTHGPTPVARHGHRAVTIRELMIVFGGGNEGLVEEIHVYNTVTNQWFVPTVRGEKPNGLAAFGMVPSECNIYFFGGMMQQGRFSNDLYELQASRWEWTKLRARMKTPGAFPPSPRIAHTFNIDSKGIVYLFGGLTQENTDCPSLNPRETKGIPKYLNDLYILDLKRSTRDLEWEVPKTYGRQPFPRESHSAVIYETSAKRQLIIFGGMNGQRLGDLWILDLNTWTWDNPYTDGIPPLPRSLHSANMIGDRMYIFGGWVPVDLETDALTTFKQKAWKCSNTLAVYNVLTNTWEQPQLVSDSASHELIRARAGHSSVVINDRLWVWSGRDGFRRTWNAQVCCRDMWYLETKLPDPPTRIQLIKAYTNSLEVSWQSVPNAEAYHLQIQRLDMDKDGRYAVSSVSKVLAAVRQVKVVRPDNTTQILRVVKPSTAQTPQKITPRTFILHKTGTTHTSVAQPSRSNYGQTQVPRASHSVSDPEQSLPQNLLENNQDDVPGDATNTSNTQSEGPGVPTKESETSEGQSSEQQVPQQQEEVERRTPESLWCDVGIIKGTQLVVTQYNAPSRERPEQFYDVDNMTSEDTPKCDLEAGVAYRFRIASINALGRGPWSEYGLFKTCTPGFPGAPSSIRITKQANESASVHWEPPQNTAGRITEYSVYLAVKNNESSSTAFMRVYVGTEAFCTVTKEQLVSAHIDATTKPAIVFRIAAKNEKGYGPATQVRWLQEPRDVRPVAQSMGHHLSTHHPVPGQSHLVRRPPGTYLTMVKRARFDGGMPHPGPHHPPH